MSTFITKITSFFMTMLTALSLSPVINFFIGDEGIIKKIAFASYNEQYEKFCKIPALDEDFVPQGLDYCDYLDKILVCGYMNIDAASRIYVINPQSGICEKYVTLKESNGEEYTGHCGGIASFESNAWVVSGKYARRLSLSLLKNAENGDSIQFADKFNTGTRASYINCSNGILWVGEYHKNGDEYVTEESHHLTSPNGEEMKAWTMGYILESDNPTGFDYNGTSKEIVIPDYILATESMCQGFAQLPDGRFLTSISGQITKSELNTYENVLNKEADATVVISDQEVGIRFLNSAAKMSSLNILPRSEGIDIYGNKLLVLYESGAKKLSLSQIVSTSYIWSTEF